MNNERFINAAVIAMTIVGLGSMGFAGKLMWGHLEKEREEKRKEKGR